jgi:hypothetical protein
MPNGRCKLHGGASLVGPAHPNWRHGRHSKFLPTQLAERYLQAVNDPTLISLRDEMALISVRVSQLLETVGKTGNTRLWRDARQRLDAFKAAGGKGKTAVGQARIALQQLDDVLAAGLSAAATWDELRETIELQRRLTDSETRRERDLRQLISVSQAISLIGVLIEEINRRVADREVRAALARVCMGLLGRGSGAPPQS